MKHIMGQGVLPFKYEEENHSGMTALAGWQVYFDLSEGIDLSKSIKKHLKIMRKQSELDRYTGGTVFDFAKSSRRRYR